MCCRPVPSCVPAAPGTANPSARYPLCPGKYLLAWQALSLLGPLPPVPGEISGARHILRARLRSLRRHLHRPSIFWGWLFGTVQPDRFVIPGCPVSPAGVTIILCAPCQSDGNGQSRDCPHPLAPRLPRQKNLIVSKHKKNAGYSSRLRSEPLHHLPEPRRMHCRVYPSSFAPVRRKYNYPLKRTKTDLPLAGAVFRCRDAARHQ